MKGILYRQQKSELFPVYAQTTQKEILIFSKSESKTPILTFFPKEIKLIKSIPDHTKDKETKPNDEDEGLYKISDSDKDLSGIKTKEEMFLFEVEVGTRHFVFGSKSEAERDQWIRAFQFLPPLITFPKPDLKTLPKFSTKMIQKSQSIKTDRENISKEKADEKKNEKVIEKKKEYSTVEMPDFDHIVSEAIKNSQEKLSEPVAEPRNSFILGDQLLIDSIISSPVVEETIKEEEPTKGEPKEEPNKVETIEQQKDEQKEQPIVKKKWMKAIFDYQARTASELSIQIGDVIELEPSHHEDYCGYLKGRTKGKSGFFPEMICEELEKNE